MKPAADGMRIVLTIWRERKFQTRRLEPSIGSPGVA
jgi:hypothetical protein